MLVAAVRQRFPDVPQVRGFLLRAPLVILTLPISKIHHKSDCTRRQPVINLLENTK